MSFLTGGALLQSWLCASVDRFEARPIWEMSVNLFRSGPRALQRLLTCSNRRLV